MDWILDQKKVRREFAQVTLCVCMFALMVACGSKAAPEESNSAQRTAGETLRVTRIETLENGPIPGAVSRVQDGWRVASGQQWGFAAVVPFDGFGRRGVNGAVEVKLTVSAGKVGVGLLTSGNQLLQEKFADAGPGEQLLTFTLGQEDFRSVIIRSGAPTGTNSDATVMAVDYVFRVAALPGAVSLQQIAKTDPSSSLETGPPARVITGTHKYAYAAHIPLTLPSAGKFLAFVRVHGRVARGRIGIGILDTPETRVQTERFYDPAATSRDYFAAAPDPARAASVLFRTDRDEASEIVIEQVTAYRIL